MNYLPAALPLLPALGKVHQDGGYFPIPLIWGFNQGHMWQKQQYVSSKPRPRVSAHPANTAATLHGEEPAQGATVPENRRQWSSPDPAHSLKQSCLGLPERKINGFFWRFLVTCYVALMQQKPNAVAMDSALTEGFCCSLGKNPH